MSRRTGETAMPLWGWVLIAGVVVALVVGVDRGVAAAKARRREQAVQRHQDEVELEQGWREAD